MDTSVYRQGNQLLDALSIDEKARLYPQLEAVDLPFGMVVYSAGMVRKYIYFLCTAVMSYQYTTTDGSSAETAAVGSEGMVGSSVIMGDDRSPGRAVVRVAGRGFRLDAEIIKQEFYRDGSLRHLLLRHTQALMTQTSQTLACNRQHSIEQQVCRRLLMSLDQTHGTEVLMTHQVIAGLLGIRREGVTDSANILRNAGIIRYVRGRISVVNRTELEKRACECYRVIRGEYDHLQCAHCKRALDVPPPKTLCSSCSNLKQGMLPRSRPPLARDAMA